jgi:hypothetical protein
MKINLFLATAFFTLFFSSCGSNNKKKVIVMASGKLTINGTTIQIEPSFTHNEQELIFTDEKLKLTIESTAGNKTTLDLAEKGVYVLNLQKDTLIGGVVNYGTGPAPSSIEKEVMDRMIDSTKQLMAGTNVSDAAKTYFLPPFAIKKITEDYEAKIVGSVRGIPYKLEAGADGKIPEVYKFYTNKQKRETLDDLMKERAKILSK